MREHINSMGWDTLEKIFREITNAIEGDSIYKLVNQFISSTIYAIESSIDTKDIISRQMRIVIMGESHSVHVTKKPEEAGYFLDVRFCLFCFYPDGWIDLPD